MENKQTENGIVKVLNTTKLQLKSLDDFAKVLGYERGKDNQFDRLGTWVLATSCTPDDFELKYKLGQQKPCISFNTMVRWHNGNFGRFKFNLDTRGYWSKVQELTDIPVELMKKAFNKRHVYTVKIQRKKDTTLVVQDHLVKVIKEVSNAK